MPNQAPLDYRTL